nr:MAG TPA: hypothetical protein [Caudoviricetes sp.]
MKSNYRYFAELPKVPTQSTYNNNSLWLQQEVKQRCFAHRYCRFTKM